MSDIEVRAEGCVGRITLNRPEALNAMTYDMCMAIDAALSIWMDNDRIRMIVLDAAGDKAFCAGGDIAQLYETGKAGDYEFGQRFWRDEYRMNARLFEYPKPVVSFLQGFTMGGGVGIGCHGTHRIVCETSRIAMPECGIGLVPDVGGTLMLALAPGRLGEYLSVTAARMNAGDAIHAGFADHYVPREHWTDLISLLEASGDPSPILKFSETPPQGEIMEQQAQIETHFGGETLSDIRNSLTADGGAFAQSALKAMARNAPLSMACTAEMLHRLRGPSITIRKALEMEYRFTFRAMADGDFLEGIRAQIIDKDRNPKWQFADGNVPATAVSAMLLPLGEDALTF